MQHNMCIIIYTSSTCNLTLQHLHIVLLITYLYNRIRNNNNKVLKKNHNEGFFREIRNSLMSKFGA